MMTFLVTIISSLMWEPVRTAGMPPQYQADEEWLTWILERPTSVCARFRPARAIVTQEMRGVLNGLSHEHGCITHHTSLKMLSERYRSTPTPSYHLIRQTHPTPRTCRPSFLSHDGQESLHRIDKHAAREGLHKNIAQLLISSLHKRHGLRHIQASDPFDSLALVQKYCLFLSLSSFPRYGSLKILGSAALCPSRLSARHGHALQRSNAGCDGPALYDKALFGRYR